MVEGIRAEIRRVAPDLPIEGTVTMDEAVAASVAAPRFRTLLLGLFATTATLIATMLLKLGHADAMLCGLHGRYDSHFEYVKNVIGQKPGAKVFATMNALMLDEHNLFITDTYINDQPSADLLTQRIEVHEKTAWMLRSLLEE